MGSLKMIKSFTKAFTLAAAAPLAAALLATSALADGVGIVAEQDSEVAAGRLPAEWEEGLAPALEALWRVLFRLPSWDPLDGWRGADAVGASPFPSGCLLVFLLLVRLPEGAWASPAALEGWLAERHPYWANEDLPPSRRRPWVESFLLGLAYELEAARPWAHRWPPVSVERMG